MWNQNKPENAADGAPASRTQAQHGIAWRLNQLARQTPTAVAIQAGTQSLTYADLDERANAVAGLLQSVGVDKDVVVGIAADRSIERIVASLAVWRAGGAFLPLDPSWPIERQRALLDDARATVVVGPNESVQRLANADRIAVPLDSDMKSFGRFGERETMVPASATDLAYVIYTSGSTGEPKGVAIGHGNLINLIAWHHDAFAVTADDNASHLAGLGFDASIWEIWPTLAAGARVTLAPEFVRTSVRQLRDWLVAQKITVAFLPTALAEPMLAMQWPADTALRHLLTGADTLHAFARPGLPFAVVNNYGPTECTVVATSGAVPTHAEPGEMPSIGKPIANTQIHLLDEHGKPVAAGWPGEIHIGGASVGLGYRGRPDLTAERFLPDPFSKEPGARLYRTGDLGCLLPSGEIAFRGRIDNQEKIRGYRVEPDGIAAALDQHELVGSCAVIARVSPFGDKQLVAYVVAAEDLKPTSEELRDFLGATLPDYMIPASFVGLDALPLNSNGKLDKAALPEPTGSNTLDQAHFRAPTTSTEERLVQIVAEVLGVPQVGADDNFFLVGGHSLLGTQVVIRAREAFGVELTLWHLFEAQTVANLAATIEDLLVAEIAAMSDEEAQNLLDK